MQGVGFRAWTTRAAQRLGLDGWVKNLPDGRVEAYFEGSTEVVEEMIALLHRGPIMSKVASVVAEDIPATGQVAGFAISR